MDLKSYVIDKFEKYYLENNKPVNLREVCYLYMDKNTLTKILDDKEFYKLDENNYGLIKWVLEDICKRLNEGELFESIDIKEIAEKNYKLKINNLSEILKKLNIKKEDGKLNKVNFKELLKEYNIDYKLDLLEGINSEKNLIDELEEELITEKKIIKKLEEKLREQELFKINIELEEIMKCYSDIKDISLDCKIIKYIKANKDGISFDELYRNVSILEKITREELNEILITSKSLVKNDKDLWVLKNSINENKEIDMQRLIEIIEEYVECSTSKTLKKSWDIFREYNFTKEEKSLQKIGEKYGYTRDYTFQLHNMSIEIFEYKRIKRYLDAYIKNVEEILSEEKFIRLKSENYKKIFGYWNTKKLINFINKFGMDLILTDNKYVMSRKLYEDYFYSKKQKSFKTLNKEYIVKHAN